MTRWSVWKITLWRLILVSVCCDICLQFYEETTIFIWDCVDHLKTAWCSNELAAWRRLKATWLKSCVEATCVEKTTSMLRWASCLQTATWRLHWRLNGGSCVKRETCCVERLQLREGFGDIMYALGRYKDRDMLLLCEHHHWRLRVDYSLPYQLHGEWLRNNVCCIDISWKIVFSIVKTAYFSACNSTIYELQSLVHLVRLPSLLLGSA